MANNRMYLRHKTSGKSITLAKYYPSTGWYQFRAEAEVNEFFEQARQDADNNRTVDYRYGPTDFELVFEEEEHVWAESILGPEGPGGNGDGIPSPPC